MKYVRILGLAAVAAAALMAFVGASTASATVLCTVEGTGSPTGTTCPEGKAEPGGTEIKSSLVAGTKAVLATSFKTIECKKSSVAGKTSNEGSATETVTGSITTLTFEECNCVINVLKNGSLEVHWISGTHDGTVTSSGAEVTAECETLFGKVHCIYTTNATDLGTLAHGNPAKLEVKEASIPRAPTNALCAEKALWTATYEVTTPKPLFIAGHT